MRTMKPNPRSIVEPVPLPPQLAEVADKYALLIKYSHRARVVDARLSGLPDDLRERFKQAAVLHPNSIEEIADALHAERQGRRSPLGDPKLDAIFRDLEMCGAEAQMEFKRAFDFLKGHVDPEKVFSQIAAERAAVASSRKAADQMAPSLMGYCPECNKLRNSAILKCAYCGNMAPVLTDQRSDLSARLDARMASLSDVAAELRQAMGTQRSSRQKTHLGVKVSLFLLFVTVIGFMAIELLGGG